MKEKDNSKEMIKQKSVDLIAPMLESIERMNDNFEPMLESIERINDSLAPFISPMLENIERINDNLAPILQQMIESWSQMREEFSYEYDGIQTQFNSYFDKEGIVRPKDVDEFLFWLINKNPDIPMWELIDEAKRPYNYNLFHEYKVKCFKEDWNLAKEIGYWEKNDDGLSKPKENGFSVTEWASIFYYAVGRYLKKGEVTERLSEFMEEFDVPTTSKNFRNNFYKVRKRINENNDYPIEKLQKIIPFMKDHYKQAVPFIKSDIDFLKEEQSHNQ